MHYNKYHPLGVVLQPTRCLSKTFLGHILVVMKKNGSIKQKIYEVRRSKGISQEKMASLIGVALNSYRKLERGKTNLVNEKLWDIADALDVSVKELVLKEDALTGSSLADMERAKYHAKITSLEEEIATLKQCVSLLNEKNESNKKNRGAAYQ